MRKLVYHISTTLDNFICHEDGTTDGFLTEGTFISEYLESLKGYDTVVMGRRTYEYGYAYGLQPGARAYPHMRHYIFSKTLTLQNNAGIEIIKDDPASHVQRLKAEEGTPVYLCGGGSLAGYLFDRGLIDDVFLKLHPVLFGRGIRLFEGAQSKESLQLNDTKSYGNGVLLLKYHICK